MWRIADKKVKYNAVPDTDTDPSSSQIFAVVVAGARRSKVTSRHRCGTRCLVQLDSRRVPYAESVESRASRCTRTGPPSSTRPSTWSSFAPAVSSSLTPTRPPPVNAAGAPYAPSPTTSLLCRTMAAFVPTVAAPGCSWTPAARAVCATRPLGTGAPAARHPTRRVRAGRVTVTAAAKPLDVTADTFDVEVMQSVRFAVRQGHCGSVVLAGSGVCFVRAHWKRVCARRSGRRHLLAVVCGWRAGVRLHRGDGSACQATRSADWVWMPDARSPLPRAWQPARSRPGPVDLCAGCGG